ncbi:MAG: class I tRNA ligase family protein, partial [Candidatus Aenigmatarchaeota archaeon]
MKDEYNQERIEKEVKEFWKENGIPQKTMDSKSENKGEKEFLFLEGPPGTTGKMHIGHVRGRVIKDIMFRSKTMQGYYVPRQSGWDMQGLPVELETEKKLDVESKKDIEDRIGTKKFIEECKKVAYKYMDEWKGVSKNLGMWMDWDNPYKTLTDEHMERVWKVIKKAHKEGWLTRKLMSNPICPSCQTALSQHEVDQGYSEREDYSIFVKFPVVGHEDEYILIWTTTPWTIPSNMAVAVHPDFDYVKAKVGDDVLIFAEDLLEELKNKLGVEEVDVIDRMKGEELDGIRYEHPLKDLVPKHKEFREEGYTHHIFLEDFVTLEEGTGC